MKIYGMGQISLAFCYQFILIFLMHYLCETIINAFIMHLMSYDIPSNLIQCILIKHDFHIHLNQKNKCQCRNIFG